MLETASVLDQIPELIGMEYGPTELIGMKVSCRVCTPQHIFLLHSLMLSRRSQIHCPYCPKALPSREAVNRHISHSRKCQKQWKKDLLQRRAKTFRPEETIDVVGGQTMVAENDDQISDVEMTAPDVEYIPPCRNESPEPEIHVHEPNRRAQVEESDDESFTGARVGAEKQWAGRYPSPAGETSGKASTIFEKWHTELCENDRTPLYPFSSQEEWELAQWLMKSVGQTSIDEYLKLPIVSE